MIAKDRDEAFENMNGALRRKTQKCDNMIGKAQADNLRFYWNLGREINEVKENADGKYGEGNPYRLMETALYSNRRQLRKASAFARLYNEEQLTALLELTHPETGFRLHWGHVSYLLTLNTPKQRETWAERCVRNMWDPPALNAAIIKHFGHRTADPHGRPHKMPATVHLQIRQILDKTGDWLKKEAALWNGDDASVVANILTTPPDELTEADHENLVRIQELLPQLRTKASELEQQIGRTVEHVAGVLEARAAREAEAAEAADGIGKEGRSVQLDSPKSRRRRRVKAKAS